MKRILFLLATFLFADAMAMPTGQTFLALGDSYTIGD